MPTPNPVAHLVDTMDQLTTMLDAETEGVKTSNREVLTEVLPSKLRLTLDYEASLKGLTAKPDLLAALPKPIQAALRQSGEKLRDATHRNAVALRSAAESTQRLVESIIRLVREEVEPIKGYNNPKSPPATSYSPVTPPVMVNRTV